MRGRALLLALCAVASCKKKDTEWVSPSQTGAAIERLAGFAEQLCACADKVCSDQVQEAMRQWSATAGSQLGKPDGAQAAKLATISTRLNECYARMNAVPAAPVEPPAPAAPDLPEQLTAPFAADRVLAAARAWAAKEHPNLHVVRAVFSYVDADGMLDATDGRFELELGNALPGDNPARRTGAPVRDPAKATICAYLRFDGEWHRDSRSCRDTVAAPPHCATTVVWQRALDKGAPRDAVAVIEYQPARGTTTPWKFSITDAPRNVSFVQRFADDCETVIEQPPN